MMISRRHTSSMSPRSCEVSMRVTPRSRLTAFRNSRMRSFTATSRPMVGSSRKMMAGLCISATARSARIRWPSESRRADWRRILLQPEHLGEVGEVLAVGFFGHLVDIPQEREGFDHRDVPPQLGALAEDDADVFRVPHPFLVRVKAVDADLAAGGQEDSGEHLDRRGFAGPVRADIGDGFAGLDGKVDVRHRDDLLVFRTEKMPDGADHARFFHGAPEGFAEPFRFDDGHGNASGENANNKVKTPL